MNITHTWIIKKLHQIDNGTGTVSTVDYKVVSRDEDTKIAVSYPDFVVLETQNIDEDNFVPYNQLTEQEVIQFVKNKLGDEVQEIENFNALKIQNKINPPSSDLVIENLPWS